MIKVLLLIVSCSCMGVFYISHAQSDTIRPGESIRFSDSLVSANKRFSLEFQRFVDSDNDDYRYLRIRNSDGTTVWVANRTTPVYSSSGNFTMDGDGLLMIMSDRGSPIVLNPDRASRNSSATLRDDGNFILTELNPDGSTRGILWESFDFPVDTLLPGMKLGMSFRTGQEWILTSSISNQVAAPGAFTLEWGNNGSGIAQLIARRRGEVYWMSGALNTNDRSFENIMWLMSPWTQNNYNFSHVSNENESYFSYSVLDGAISRWSLDPSGSLSDTLKPVFLLGANCYGLPGCQLREPACKNETDAFVLQRGRFQGFPSSSQGNLSIGLGDCSAQCWNTCSCVGYATLHTNGTGCELWNRDLNFTDDANDRVVYVLNSTLAGDESNAVTGSGNENNWWIWIIVAFASVLILLALSFLCYLRRKKLREEKEREEEDILLELTTSSEVGSDGRKGHDLKVFPFASINAATNGFSSENKLGEGGFGPVYKGKLQDGEEIAVKRLSRSSGQGLVEFKNELILIAKLQHMNLVRLLGCCVKAGEKMLIYEYMPNKSLDFFLFDPTRREQLKWKIRFSIIEGIAQGLLYLHRHSRLRVIHRDLKASNILLDSDMNPKISDFGMARIFSRNESEANTNRVVGTYGYMSPEYAMEGNFSEKSDVYSFGVLLLELVSGQKNNRIFQHDRPMNLVGYAWELWKDERSLELLDDSIVVGDENATYQALRCMLVGLLCVQQSATERPTMSDVISMIGNETLPLPPPKQGSFSTHQTSVQISLSKAKQGSGSICTSITISDMEAR
ncbi:G-type lectin S-receptor-like serine/threonine-protein kinase CES101 [Hibiscus syriacus]|uniref:G-type lectin S-receptor-like serine/threonine-protein kinase CES101 n=1 Tax=Hibiscus syriacus TaxID=106335 RepID=UPI0019218460|nr:G-type lectin S-receptor-like serine/threonine-protein kinase CES101 [Hibiscus syriacus]